MKLVNKTGYLKGAKTAKNPVNIIPSNLITTQGMAFPIKANGKTLYPNTGQYKFPTSHVVETPLKQKGAKKTKTFNFTPNTSLAKDNTVNTQGREAAKADKFNLQKTKDYNAAQASWAVAGDKGAEDKFYSRYGEGSNKFRYDTDPNYAAQMDKNLKEAEKAGRPMLKENVKLDPNAMFMLPIGLKGQAAKDYQDFHKEVILNALPIPGIPKSLRQVKNISKQVPAQMPTLSSNIINLERQSSKPKNTIFKFNIDVPHPSLKIRKKFRGNKDIPKELIVEGKSGYIKANRRPDDGSYYFNANMQNPLESGKAMLELDKLLTPKPSIYDNNSLSLDSYKAMLNLRNRKHWSGEHIGFIPLNESAIHNKTLHKLGIKPDASKVSFDTEDKANTALGEINNMLQKQGIEHKAELFKHTDGGFGINMPNFKVSRDYKKGSKNMSSLIKYKDGSKGVSLSFSRKEKDPKGGLTQKGVDKYNRATGGNLKMAVTTPPSKLKAGSKDANRRASFCSRMKGMKSKLTSAKTANDPNSRINKSLRKWNCN